MNLILNTGLLRNLKKNFQSPRAILDQISQNLTWILVGFFFSLCLLFKFKINCFTEFSDFLSYVHKNQPEVHPCPLPLGPSSHLPHHPTLLDSHRATLWVPWVIQKIPIGYFTCGIVNFHVTLFIHLTFSFLLSPHVHRSVLYVCLSIAAMQINSSVPSF